MLSSGSSCLSFTLFLSLVKRFMFCPTRRYWWFLLCSAGTIPSQECPCASRICLWRRPASSSTWPPFSPRSEPAVTVRPRRAWRRPAHPSRRLQVCRVGGLSVGGWGVSNKNPVRNKLQVLLLSEEMILRKLRLVFTELWPDKNAVKAL